MFLCKRRPLGRDLLTRPYGRFYYLPRLLAERGHEVRILLLDYEGGEFIDRQANGIHWLSVPFAATRPLHYLQVIKQELRRDLPDWLVGFSDTWYGVLAEHYARRFGLRACVDAYDNYESYIPWLKPLHWLWRRALRRADLVTAAGPGLLSLMTRGRNSGAAAVIPMAADPTGFKPGDRAAARREFGLNEQAPLVGYCGSLHRNRGVDLLFEAMALLRARRPEVGFVHCGRTWADVPLPEWLESFGYLEDDRVPTLLNAMDVLVVCNQDSAFGQYSHPVKLYEAMACSIAVAATETPATRWILAEHADMLVPAEDARLLCDAIERQLDRGPVDYRVINSWEESATRFADALAAELARQAAGNASHVQ